MTLEEAVKILPTIQEYFAVADVIKGLITLDGTFKVSELEAIITIYNNRDTIHLLN